MAVVRENIMFNDSVRDRFAQGVLLLDQEMPGITANDVFQFLQSNSIPLPMSGIEQQLSTYDLFVFWHVVAMSIPLTPGNAAHSGPIFLPWHRMYLIRLEQELQRVLNDDTFGLPYWDWAIDGELSETEQWQAPLWSDAYIGQARGQVQNSVLQDMRVRLYHHVTGTLVSIDPRPIEREAGIDSSNRRLPTRSHVQQALNESNYDQFPWSRSAGGHRNRLEGWINGPALHNLVHVWIGGDMSPGSSPNDPAFFLNHCNVDRIWEAWMANAGQVYQPDDSTDVMGHRLNDTMVAILGEPMTPAQVLASSTWYSYDNLTVS